MLNFPQDTKNEQKCDVTHGTMGHLDPKQPPVKRRPFAAILAHPFIQKVELLLPSEIYEIVKSNLLQEESRPVWDRVILPLSALLEGEFFNQYIKTGYVNIDLGNVMMLSEGNPNVTNKYSLREGILTMHLDKESYERAGIVGKPEGVKGKRGTKPRWIVEINLRLPSMLHGKKGFDRIVYAFRNVLLSPVTWLFHDLATTNTIPDPLTAHFPTKKVVVPEVRKDLKVNLPSFKPPPKDAQESYTGGFEDYAVELHEWLSMLALKSPRVELGDQTKTDSFLSRYVPPDDLETNHKSLVHVKWEGFLSSLWAHKIFVQLMLELPKDTWFAYIVGGFGEGWSGECKNSTILKLPEATNEYILWEVA
ncbi:ribonuclease P 40kDa subunit [Amylocarpus encephaloides]|uniref:Ribonuclease P 40kDa subunit n=1 Tax=Amylocarpus encephaloides TaxID=45428 RepID=A0A9P7YF64_9HELO|nr:ribonuclease P 40kDa subunit [Amylocarpus encephaloides]